MFYSVGTEATWVVGRPYRQPPRPDGQSSPVKVLSEAPAEDERTKDEATDEPLTARQVKRDGSALQCTFAAEVFQALFKALKLELSDFERETALTTLCTRRSFSSMGTLEQRNSM